MPSIFPSIRDFSNELQFQHQPFNKYSGLISLMIDWFDLLAVQGTLRSLLQHHDLKASFFGTQLSLWSSSHRTTGKTIALTIQTFVDKVVSLLLNTLSRLPVIAFLLRSKRLLISLLQSPSTVILEPKKIKSVTVSSHIICNYFLPVCGLFFHFV